MRKNLLHTEIDFQYVSTFFCGFFLSPVDRYFRWRTACMSFANENSKKEKVFLSEHKQKQNNDNHFQYFLTAYHMEAIIQSAFQSLQQIEISVLSFAFTFAHAAPHHLLVATGVCRTVVHGVENVFVCVSVGRRAYIPLCFNNREFLYHRIIFASLSNEHDL